MASFLKAFFSFSFIIFVRRQKRDNFIIDFDKSKGKVFRRGKWMQMSALSSQLIESATNRSNFQKFIKDQCYSNEFLSDELIFVQLIYSSEHVSWNGNIFNGNNNFKK